MSEQLLHIGINGCVAAIAPDTGKEVWRTKVAHTLLGTASGHDVCVLEHEGRVFAGCNGRLTCLDAASGRILWENGLEGLGYNDVTLSIAGKIAHLSTTETGRE